MTQLFIHVGYPKTATTTFQKRVFPNHPDIDYLGKFIPSYRYRDQLLFPELEKLVTMDESRYEGTEGVRTLMKRYRERCTNKALLISSESFIHVTAVDLAVVAGRIQSAFSPCKVIITIREQMDIIKSFYGMHGRIGQYMFLCQDETETIRFPMTIETWLEQSFRSYHKSFLSLLHYYETIQCYCRILGRDNVGIFLFEEFVHDRPTYIRKLSEFLGIDAPAMMRLVEGQHENPGRPGGTWPYLEVLTPLLSRWGLKAEKHTREEGMTELAGGRNAVQITMPPSWRERLEGLYRDGNEALMRDFKLPLEGYKYVV